MLESHVRVEKFGNYTKWTIDRPRRGNGLGPTIADELTTLLGDYSKKGLKNHVLVITAAPIQRQQHKIWIAGGDLKELSALKTAKDAMVFSKTMSQFLDNLSLLPTPVIMLIDGDAIGGGAEFALGGDIRLGTTQSRFEFKQLKMGLPTGFGGTRRLIQIVGKSRAERLVYGSERLTAPDAHALGLIHDMAPDEKDLELLTEGWVERLSAMDFQAFSAQKAMFQVGRDLVKNTSDYESQLFSQAWNNPFHRLRVDEFLAKSSRD
jgi:enoyl-CoA hydratase